MDKLLPLLLAAAIPLAFVYGVRRLNLYASETMRPVVGCLIGGALATLPAYALNTAASSLLPLVLVTTLFAPVVEELVKSMGVIHFERQKDFTYFVDGAVYGFAAGTAFAVVENGFMLQRAAEAQALGLSLQRVFSTSLMHGTASALVGIALGRFRFGHGRRRAQALAGGWLMAMALHISFNAVTQQSASTAVPQLLAIGLVGLTSVIVAILIGLREERKWLEETLVPAIGVTGPEAALVMRLDQLDTLLAPVALRFGRHKRDAVEAFIRCEVQLGLKKKALSLCDEPELAAQLATEIQALDTELNRLRRQVGLYGMVYVRSILPSPSVPLWQRLRAQLGSDARAVPQGNLWHTVRARTGQSAARQVEAAADSPLAPWRSLRNHMKGPGVEADPGPLPESSAGD